MNQTEKLEYSPHKKRLFSYGMDLESRVTMLLIIFSRQDFIALTAAYPSPISTGASMISVDQDGTVKEFDAVVAILQLQGELGNWR